MFYYLVAKQEATRDELASLFWGECGEKTAKKNLRNALFTIRRSFDLEIVTSPQKQLVMLNPDIPLETDLNIFLKNNAQSLKAYSGEFLQGFLVKDAEAFMDWKRRQTEALRQTYISMLYAAIKKNLAAHKVKKVEKFAKLLIDTDVFEEKAYRVLMQIYAESGAFHMALEIYHQLEEALDKELGIAPEAKTKELLVQIMKMRKARAQFEEESREEFFYGRQQELQTLTDDFDRFRQGKSFRFILIEGEPGIGKTRLKDEFIKHIDQDEVYLFETNCYQAEEGYFLKPWNKIFSQLYPIIAREDISIPLLWKNIAAYLFPIFATEYTSENINPMEKLDSIKPKVIDDAVISVLQTVSQKKKIVLIFEDMQWIDTMSLSLLNNILLPREYQHIFFIGTLRNGYGYRTEIDRFITLLAKYDHVQRINLARFSKQEVSEFITQALPAHKISGKLKERLYHETEGNAFFLWEYLNVIREKRDIPAFTAKMQDILKSRMIDISSEGQKILNILSLFFDEVPWELLAEVSGKSELLLLDLIEELKNKSLLKEVGLQQQVGYTFTHHKIREFIYSQQSLGRRRILHNKIGLLLEQGLLHSKRDYLTYPALIYHFSHAGKLKQTLKYCLKNASVYLDISHELFPELSDPDAQGNRYLQITREAAVKYLEEIDMLLEEIKEQENLTPEIKCMEIEFHHMFGRFLIREGQYKKGINLIQQVIDTSLEIQNWGFASRGYKQLIFYAIQTHNVKLMEGYLESALALAREHKLRKDLGTLLRLKGLNRIMAGRYAEAEKLLKKSLDIFTAIDQSEKYSLCVAAVHNYLGEIRRYKQEYPQAIACYEQAIAISRDKEVISSLALFHTNAGQAAFENQDFKKAKIYLKKARELYSQFDNIWGRSTAEGFSALLFIQDGQYRNALACLQRADRFAHKLKNPRELSLVQRVKSDIKAIADQDHRLKELFSPHLYSSPSPKDDLPQK